MIPFAGMLASVFHNCNSVDTYIYIYMLLAPQPCSFDLAAKFVVLVLSVHISFYSEFIQISYWKFERAPWNDDNIMFLLYSI